MQTANMHAIGASAQQAPGKAVDTSPVSPSRCLIHSHDLLNALSQAKTQRDRNGRGGAYSRLLIHFHRAIFPAFLADAGSVLEASKLLGIHRETLSRYLDVAGISCATRSAGGAA